MSLIFLLTSFVVFQLSTSVSCAEPEIITYAIVAPKSFRPGSVYNVTATFYDAKGSVSLTLSLTGSDKRVLVQKNVTLEDDESRMVSIHVPSDVPDTVTYSLVATGRNGLTFDTRHEVKVQRKTLSLFVQTDKAIYKPGQTVLFRVIAVYPDLKPYQGLVDVSVSDSGDNKIMQWLKRQNTTGVIGEQLVLADQTPLGDWTIRVSAGDNEFSKTFQVAKYVLPKFKVTVNLPSRYLVNKNRPDIQEDLRVTVQAEYTYGEPVQGRANVKIRLLRSDHPSRSIERNVLLVNGKADLTLTIHEIQTLVQSSFLWMTLSYHQTIFVDADVEETVTGVVLSGNTTVECTSERYTLKFLDISLSVFKPGLLYHGHLQLAQSDGTAPNLNDLSQSKSDGTSTEVQLRTTMLKGYSAHDRYMATEILSVSQTGHMRFSLQIGLDIVSIELEASHYDSITNSTITASKSLSPFKSRDKEGIQISCDSPTGFIQALQDVTFSVKTTQPISRFQYEILSKGTIVLSRFVTRPSPSSANSFVVHVSKALVASLSPSARVVVWFITSGGEIIADGIDITVQGGFANHVSLSFDAVEARPGGKVNLTVEAGGGSYVGILAIDQSVLLLAGGNDITQAMLTQDLQSYDITSSRKIQFNYDIVIDGSDSQNVLENSGVFIMTNGYMYKTPVYVDERYYHRELSREILMAIHPALDQLFKKAESGSVQSTPELDEPSQSTPRVYFPETWLWTNSIIGSDGKKTLVVELPDTITSWIASAFAINDQDGLGVAANTAKVTGFKPFFLSPTLPYSIIRGEQFALRISVFNYLDTTLDVRVTLLKSNYFKVLATTDNSSVYASSDVTETVQVASRNAVAVDFWIKAESLGEIPISLTALSSVAGDAVIVTLRVLPEGTLKEYSTSAFVSLSSSKVEMFDTTFSIALPSAGQLVPGSEYIELTVVGDVMGPAISGLGNLLRMPTGCGEQTMLALAPNVYILKYLTSTGKLNSAIRTAALKFIISGYQRELTFKRNDNSFSAFGNSDIAGSTWLTAFVIRCFHQAKDFIPIDDEMIAGAMTWILGNQAENGEFEEPRLGRVIHVEMQGGSSRGVPLTAYVLISFLENRDNSHIVHVSLKRSVASAKKRLEHEIPYVAEDPYSLCITSYALARVNSSRLADVLKALKAVAKTDDDGSIHWEQQAPASSDQPSSDQWFQPPYVQSKAINIEMTSYALLTYSYLNDISTASKISKWIMSQRNPSGGFSSTQDTVLALEALAAFALLTDSGSSNLNVVIATKGRDSDNDISHKYQPITADNAILLQSFQLPADSSEVHISASGQGKALVQLIVKYNIYNDQTNDAISLDISSKWKDNRVIVRTCSSWKNNALGSGMVVLEINQLTGYQATNIDDLQKQTTGLKRVDSSNNQIILYLDELTSKETCIVLTSDKVLPVNNVQAAPVKVYSYYNPSSFATKFYKPALYNSDVFVKLENSGVLGSERLIVLANSNSNLKWQNMPVLLMFIVWIVFGLNVLH